MSLCICWACNQKVSSNRCSGPGSPGPLSLYPVDQFTNPSTYWGDRIEFDLLKSSYIHTPLKLQHILIYSDSPVLNVIALELLLRIGYRFYTLTEQTDTSSHSRLFVDGRLAGSSCLVGCAGMGPVRTSWQSCLRQPCACLFSLGMIHVEQKHHSTQSLDSRPGAICKTLGSNTRTSYDPRQGGHQQKRIPTQQACIRGGIESSHSSEKWQWEKKDTRLNALIRRQWCQLELCSLHSSKITRIQFIYWQSMLAEWIWAKYADKKKLRTLSVNMYSAKMCR